MPVPGVRLAFVTGAGSGIGRASALRLARDGFRIVATDLRLDLARETALAAGTSATAAALDVRDEAAWERTFAAPCETPVAAVAEAASSTWPRGPGPSACRARWPTRPARPR